MDTPRSTHPAFSRADRRRLSQALAQARDARLYRRLQAVAEIAAGEPVDVVAKRACWTQHSLSLDRTLPGRTSAVSARRWKTVWSSAHGAGPARQEAPPTPHERPKPVRQSRHCLDRADAGYTSAQTGRRDQCPHTAP